MIRFFYRILFLTSFLALLVFAPTASSSAARQTPFIKGPITGEVLAVLDGDTITVRAQVWLGQSVETSVRISGLDTPEMRSDCAHERDMAETARRTLEELVKDGTVELYNIRNDKYGGRVVAEVRTSRGTAITPYMIDKGLAYAYEGKTKKKWC